MDALSKIGDRNIRMAYIENVRVVDSCPRWSIWLGYQTLTLMGRVQSPGAELFYSLNFWEIIGRREYPEGRAIKLLSENCDEFLVIGIALLYEA